MLGVGPPDSAGDVVTPVPALGRILGVAQSQHQFVTDFCILGQAETFLRTVGFTISFGSVEDPRS